MTSEQSGQSSPSNEMDSKAYLEGYAKGNAGVHSAYCPQRYFFNDPLKNEWMKGWQAGQKDAGLDTHKRQVITYLSIALLLVLLAYALYANFSSLELSQKTTQTLTVVDNQSANAAILSIASTSQKIEPTNGIHSNPTLSTTAPITTDQLLAQLEQKADQLVEAENTDALTEHAEQTSSRLKESISNPDTKQAPIDSTEQLEIERLDIKQEKGLSSHAKRFQFTSSIVSREPVDQLLALSKPAKIYFFSAIINLENQTVYHNWYLNNQLITRKSFDVKGPRWRIYSADSFSPGTSGILTVKILTEEGSVIVESSLPISIPVIDIETSITQ